MKTILITGSSRGIGRAVAELAHKQGYRVILHGKTDSDALKNVQRSLDGSLKVVFDIADKSAVHNGINKFLEEVGTIDVLVNNAG
ncbi:MAG TPA: SDR family NAD(P)-dependent oxidoreductase, partial [Candidatus Saccharimonadales bacterium]|nr:SDR family NAD(P)-dependent oxidoreductase [Candidatus Saccharimonadales bacterium]